MGLQLGQQESAAEGIWANVAWTDSAGFVWWLDSEPALTDDGEHDARLKVARSNNPDAKAYARKMARKYRQLRRRRGGDLPDRIVTANLREQYAHTVLLDWEGVEMPDEGTVSYTPEYGVAAFEADEAFLELVVDIAGAHDAFRTQAIQEDAEDLGNASDGRSDGAPTSES